MKRAKNVLRLWQIFTDAINANENHEPKDLEILKENQRAYADQYAELTLGDPKVLQDLGFPLPVKDSLK